MDTRQEPLDVLCQVLGLSYLSDLNRVCPALLAKKLRELPSGDYPVQCWRDCAQYLVGRQDWPARPEEIKRALLDALTGEG